MDLSCWINFINYSTSICPFESGKSGTEEEKIQKFEYLESEKSFLDEIKNIFYRFWRVIIWWKNKNLMKNSRRKFQACFKCMLGEPATNFWSPTFSWLLYFDDLSVSVHTKYSLEFLVGNAQTYSLDLFSSGEMSV